MLTLKQKKLLDYIVQYCSSNKIYPTFDEMRSFLNIKSKSGIHKLLSSLEDKGIIERLPHKARALKLKKVINLPKSDERSLPFLGRIAAGNPIEAITGSFEQISVPNYLINGKDEHFTLEVTGDSMIEDGINDGDILVVDRSIEPKNRDIVIAIFEGNLTVKRLLFKTNGLVVLKSENTAYKDIKIPESADLEIWGVVTSVIHQFIK